VLENDILKQSSAVDVFTQVIYSSDCRLELQIKWISAS